MQPIVAEAVKLFRSKRGMSQMSLARASGVSESIIGQIERGAYPHDIGIVKALRLAAALGVEVDEITALD